MYKMQSFIIIPIIFILIGSPLKGGYSGVPLSRSPELETNLGLYNSSDKVIPLTVDNVKSFISNQKYGTLLEFYNTYCGHCRRFAPKYKELAEDIYPWRRIIKVAAIDCADDNNNDICREYEILGYPSLRYFSPYYLKGDDQTKIGYQIQSQDLNEIKKTLIIQAMNESRFDNYWPDFSEITNKDIGHLIENLPEKIKYILIIYENENSTLGSNLILDFSLYDSIQIRRTTNPDIAVSFNIVTPTTISIIDKRNSNIEQIHSDNLNETSFKNHIIKFLEEKNLYTYSTTEHTSIITFQHKDIYNNISEIIEYVKDHGVHVVYRADLDHALHYALFHEIPKYININGERLLALQNFISIIKRYSPLGKNGEEFMNKLYDYVKINNENIYGNDLENYIKNIVNDNDVPLFATTDLWIGCIGSKHLSRGFTCGLWKLFHYLTVQAAENEETQDPIEVLQAIHGYVKHFFGCTDCSNHFQEMASRRKIWNVASKDDAILWLWSAHNEVNQRLAGDETEDPQFPKLQFPPPSSCHQCYNKEVSASPILDQINWNKHEILQFLKNIYNHQNISYYSLNMDQLENSKKSQMMGNVFSDMDMSFGFILYGSCIIMMIFAVKLFIFRGYRRKSHLNNTLGKFFNDCY
ncbi:sulfhydryl oxidase 1 isoform X2 [Condylostylus longicornis]|uniref:sulfhydryl oxidase 1 isoform X2 n=1 Tax=Condylostylus longicornis TaxID=2530218 RepID=UPI00244DCC66|nr:sulfhydryl oxidase 1 isoform X2 [Condylostylus longicornis]